MRKHPPNWGIVIFSALLMLTTHFIFTSLLHAGYASTWPRVLSYSMAFMISSHAFYKSQRATKWVIILWVVCAVAMFAAVIIGSIASPSVVQFVERLGHPWLIIVGVVRLLLYYKKLEIKPQDEPPAEENEP